MNLLNVKLRLLYGRSQQSSFCAEIIAEKFFDSSFVPQIGSQVCLDLPTKINMAAKVSEVCWDTATHVITVYTETQMYSDDSDAEKQRSSHREILEDQGWSCKFRN